MKPLSTALLPPGLADMLPPQAMHARRMLQHVMDSFSAFGYEEVSPPLMEFEDTLLADAQQSSLAAQTFRLLDPVSNRMLGLRTDMTGQVGRIATTRLAEAAHPLRLSYGGRCLRVKGEGLRKEREVSQAGAELIGCDTVEADIEIIRCAISALLPLGLGELTVDIRLPGLIDLLLSATTLNDTQRNEIRKSIAMKERYGLHGLPDSSKKIISDLLAVAGSGISDPRWAAIAEKMEGDMRLLYDRWLQRAKAIANSELNARITFDALEQQGFEYYTDMAFSLFAANGHNEVGRGGRYQLQNSIPSVGFTLLLHELHLATIPSAPPMVCYILSGNKEEDIARLRSKGWTTIYALATNGDAETQARNFGCTHMLADGNVKPL